MSASVLPYRGVSAIAASRRVLLSAVLVLVTGSLVFTVLAVQALVSQGSFQVREVVRRNARLERAHVQLRREVAALSAPDRLIREARRLGLRLPAVVHSLRVGPPERARGGDGPPSSARDMVDGASP